MRRREFIATLGSGVAWSLIARAQQPLIPVIGFIGGGYRAHQRSKRGSSAAMIVRSHGRGDERDASNINCIIEKAAGHAANHITNFIET